MIGFIPSSNPSVYMRSIVAGLADGAVVANIIEYPPNWPWGGGEPMVGLRILETNGSVNPGFTVNGSVGSGKVLASTNCFYFELKTGFSGQLFRVVDRMIDTTFVSPFSTNSSFGGMAALDDGGAIIAGNLKDTNGLALSPIVRLDKNGTPVPAFSEKMGSVPGVFAMTKGPSNTWYAAILEVPSGLVIRKFDIDGTFHPSFRVPVELCPQITSMYEHSDRRLAIGSDFLTATGGTFAGLMIRNPDGSPVDQAVPIAGRFFELEPYPDGGMVQLGQFANQRSIVRASANGTPVVGFDCPLLFYPGARLPVGANQVSVTQDGKILVSSHQNVLPEAGQPVIGASPIVRLLENGLIDPTFTNSTNVFATNSTADCHLLLRDGRILLSGNLRATNGAALGKIVRLLPDGTFDSTFREVLSDYRPLIIVGESTSGRIILWTLGVDPLSHLPAIRRMDEFGDWDWSFAASLSSTSLVTAVTLQRDDRILVAGKLYAADGSHLPSVVRLEPDGMIDPTFKLDVPFVGDIERMALLADGDILAAGRFEMDGQFSLVKLRSAEKPRLKPVSSGGLALELAGNIGRTYSIQSSTNFVDWISSGSVSLSSPTNLWPFPASVPTGSRFFRALLQPDP